jgi:hypothetical protein
MAFSRKRCESVKQSAAAERSGDAPPCGKTQLSGSEKRKRHAKIGFRASDEEQARIEANADRAGLTAAPIFASERSPSRFMGGNRRLHKATHEQFH